MLYICSNLIICLYNIIFSVVISYNNVHEFTNNLLTLYEIKVLMCMKSEDIQIEVKQNLTLGSVILRLVKNF